MTMAELLTEKLLAEARGRLAITGSIKPLILLLYPDGRKECAAFETPQAMNSPGASERFYDSVRCYFQASQPQAVILLDSAWTGKPTKKGQRMFEHNPAAFWRELERGLAHLVRLGLIARREALTVDVQTADSVRIVTQFTTASRASGGWSSPSGRRWTCRKPTSRGGIRCSATYAWKTLASKSASGHLPAANDHLSANDDVMSRWTRSGPGEFNDHNMWLFHNAGPPCFSNSRSSCSRRPANVLERL
jgi:hypothetical protein